MDRDGARVVEPVRGEPRVRHGGDVGPVQRTTFVPDLRVPYVAIRRFSVVPVPLGEERLEGSRLRSERLADRLVRRPEANRPVIGVEASALESHLVVRLGEVDQPELDEGDVVVVPPDHRHDEEEIAENRYWPTIA